MIRSLFAAAITILALSACGGPRVSPQTAAAIQSPDALRDSGKAIVLLHAYQKGRALSTTDTMVKVFVSRVGEKLSMATLGSEYNSIALATDTPPIVGVIEAGDYYLVGVEINYGGTKARVNPGARYLLKDGVGAPIEFSVAAGEVVSLGELEVSTVTTEAGGLFTKAKQQWRGVARPNLAKTKKALSDTYPAFADLIIEKPFACKVCPAP